MSLIADILRVVLIAAAVILAMLLWLVCARRHFWVEYSTDGLTVKMNIAFFRLRIWPLPAFVKKRNGSDPGEEKEDKAADSGRQESHTRDRLCITFDLVKQAVEAAAGTVKRIFRGIMFRDVSFTVPVYGGEPFDTQRKYARVTSAFYSFNVFLQHYVRIYYGNPLFIADFAGDHRRSLYFYCKITASPLRLLVAAIFAFKKFRKLQAKAYRPIAREKEI